MSDANEASRLLALAERDLRSLSAVLDRSDFAEETFGFLAQQTVEKSFKALLTASAIAFPLTHDLQRLYDLVPDQRAISTFEDLTDLFPFAVTFRYDNANDEEPFDRVALRDRLTLLIGVVRSELARIQNL